MNALLYINTSLLYTKNTAIAAYCINNCGQISENGSKSHIFI